MQDSNSKSSGRRRASGAPTVVVGVRATIPESGFLRLPQVLAVFPVSRSAWWAGVKDGRYPPGVKLGRRTTAWPAETIRDLIARAKGGAA